MRVFELAKQLSVPSKDLINDLKTIGVSVSNHMAALEEDAVTQILNKFGSVKKETSKPASTLVVKKKTLTARPQAAAKAAPVPAELPKGEKKLILVKRRQSEPLLGPDLLPLKPEEEMMPVEELTEATPAAGVIPSAPELTPSALPSSPEPGAMPPPFALPGLPTTGIPLPAGQTERPAWAKKAEIVPPLPDQSLKDKSKKTRRAVRDREDEPLPLRDDATRWRDLRAMPMHRREEKSRHTTPGAIAEVTKPRLRAVRLAEGLTVKEFAEAVGQKPADVMKRLMEMGMLLTLNQPLASEAASLLAESFSVRVEMVTERPAEELLVEAPAEVQESLVSRPPVVTIMGHVDHGKTSLLDAIRETKVTEGEAGGITQHIGAYVVKARGQLITFLDTPGHEAFTAMRARGAKVTDIVVLVVAADDGVMPQTIEALDHARAAEVPVIVAINKMDKPDANPDRIKNQVSERGLVPEAWGGETIFVEVSAKKKTGLETLLEMILLQAEVLELRAAPERLARGIVIEAKIDRGRGPVATVLVQNGTLRLGDPFVVGTYSGRVRALFNHAGRPVKEAGPSIPVEVVGLLGCPMAGQEFVVTKDERIAREIAESRLAKQRSVDMAPVRKVTLDDLFAQVKEGTVKELGIIIRADVQGSAEALADAVERLSAEAVKPNIILKGVGGITENDVQLASASNAIIIGFNVRPETKAATLAEREGIDIRNYSIIYEALNDIRAAMEGLLEPTFKERVTGRAEVRKVFVIPKAGAVAGCYVTDGSITRTSAGIRVVRDSAVVYEGKIGSLRRFKDDVKEVQAGYECGISVENFNDLKPGDRFEVYTLDKVLGKL
ncbi:MAG TPA: translation initiation factor IF-2 [Nitrospirales bacterium]|jgi:translation initiation factor IF-2